MSYISHYQPIPAIDMTLWLSHSQPPGPPGPGEGLAECQSPRRTAGCHQVAWLGGAVDAMLGVAWCTLRWQKHGQLAINIWCFWGKSSKNGGLNRRTSYFLEVLMGQSVTISYK